MRHLLCFILCLFFTLWCHRKIVTWQTIHKRWTFLSDTDPSSSPQTHPFHVNIRLSGSFPAISSPSFDTIVSKMLIKWFHPMLWVVGTWCMWGKCIQIVYSVWHYKDSQGSWDDESKWAEEKRINSAGNINREISGTFINKTLKHYFKRYLRQSSFIHTNSYKT